MNVRFCASSPARSHNNHNSTMGRGSGSGNGRGKVSMPDSLDDLDDCTKGAICCACVCILVTIATLIGVSFKSLEPNEVGLRFNKVSMKIDREERWDGGRHFVGVGNTCVSASVTTLSIYLVCRGGPQNDSM